MGTARCISLMAQHFLIHLRLVKISSIFHDGTMGTACFTPFGEDSTPHDGMMGTACFTPFDEDIISHDGIIGTALSATARWAAQHFLQWLEGHSTFDHHMIGSSIFLLQFDEDNTSHDDIVGTVPFTTA